MSLLPGRGASGLVTLGCRSGSTCFGLWIPRWWTCTRFPDGARYPERPDPASRSVLGRGRCRTRSYRSRAALAHPRGFPRWDADRCLRYRCESGLRFRVRVPGLKMRRSCLREWSRWSFVCRRYAVARSRPARRTGFRRSGTRFVSSLTSKEPRINLASFASVETTIIFLVWGGITPTQTEGSAKIPPSGSAFFEAFMSRLKPRPTNRDAWWLARARLYVCTGNTAARLKAAATKSRKGEANPRKKKKQIPHVYPPATAGRLTARISG